MERAAQIKKLSEKDKIWDMVVVGGGATGLGVAVDAATRGMSVACLEKTDFAKCTSSRSTKLVHGGARSPPPGAAAAPRPGLGRTSDGCLRPGDGSIHRVSASTLTPNIQEREGILWHCCFPSF